MEPVGLAIGAISLSHHLIQWTETIFNAFVLLKDPPLEATQLANELEALKNVLLSVPDLIERQATDDADVETLSLLARNSRDLQELLEDLEPLSRNLNRRSFRRSRSALSWNVGVCKTAIKRIQEGRSSLQALLRSSELAPAIANDYLDLTKSKIPHSEQPSLIAKWLDELRFPEVLEGLTARYEPGTGAWLLDNATFLEWEVNPGRTLWCSGLRK